MEILTNFSNPDSDKDPLVDKIVILINIMLTIIKEEQSKPYSCTFVEGSTFNTLSSTYFQWTIVWPL